MRETPVSGGNKSGVRNEGGFNFGCPLRHPNREDEGLFGPFLPHLTEVVGIWITIAMASSEHEGCVADDEAGVGVVVGRADNVSDLRVTSNEARLCAPDILEQQLQECHTGHGPSAHE